MATVAADVLAKLHPTLLARARELEPEDAEDFLQDVYVEFLESPPRARSPKRIKHWFRTVLRNRHVARLRALELRSPDVLN